jgi:Protein of unknown function (DUF1553)/Protein of unknown function (DUF1549)/Planctomycete cytochrome C
VIRGLIVVGMTRATMIAVLGLTGPIGGISGKVSAQPPARAMEERFEAEIRPVLVRTCFPCHGGKKTGGGLRVGTRDELVRGGESGPAVVPNQPGQSLLIRAIGHGDESLQMPPGKKLPESTIAAFTRWIAAGAPWPESVRRSGTEAAAASPRHWAFEPVKPVQPPPDPTGWSVHPIDRFIAARHKAAGLRPVADADRRTLLRRVSFDLIGLPPAPEEVADFVADDRPDAFARVVERLLASPHYGERWGRHWMDVAHYADTAGDNADYPVPELARYRDYVIDSLNVDLPFDRFVREQLAGDILAGQAGPEGASAPIVATGFLALSRRYATAPYELWHLTLEDAIETTGRAFLGLTLRCARCHDHKYDPLPQRDYYALYGIFASTRFPYAGSEEFQTKKFPRQNFVPTAAAGVVAAGVRARDDRLKSLEREIADIESTMAGKKAPSKAGRADPPRLAALRKEHDRLRRAGLPPDLPCAYAVSEGPPQDAAVQRGGDPGRAGPVVPRGVPRLAFFSGASPPAVAAGASGRLELAQWITRPDHPLTARVIANRVWQHHFGRGIVSTPSNFGVRGEPPSHPALLDWLAARLVASGWSIKDLHRQILLSHTYRLASEFDGRSAGADPGNHWLWRFDRRRLDAESIRDAMLAVSGQLDRRRPSAHPFPPIEDWHWTQHNAFKAVYPSEQRSVFLMTQRLVKHPFLAIFDGPDTNTSTDVRPNSTVPLQALYLMNNPFVQEQSAALARRLLHEACDTPRRLERAWELAWSRPPAQRENERACRYLATYSAAAAASGIRNDRLDLEAWTSLARILMTANDFLYIE